MVKTGTNVAGTIVNLAPSSATNTYVSPYAPKKLRERSYVPTLSCSIVASS